MKPTVARLGLLALILGLLGSSTVALAQSAPELDPAGDPAYQNSERDGLFSDQDSGLNPFDLLHRSRLRPSRSVTEFETDGQGQIDEAGAEFRRQQQQRLNCTNAAGTVATDLSACTEL